MNKQSNSYHENGFQYANSKFIYLIEDMHMAAIADIGR